MGLAGADRDAVERERLRARRRSAVRLGPLSRGDLRGHDLRALGRGDRRRPAPPGRHKPSPADAPHGDRRGRGPHRVTAAFAQVAKHNGVELWICPPRPSERNGVVAAAIKYAPRLSESARPWQRHGSLRARTSADRPPAPRPDAALQRRHRGRARTPLSPGNRVTGGQPRPRVRIPPSPSGLDCRPRAP